MEKYVKLERGDKNFGDYRVDGIVDRIETDIHEKFKNVQCATAVKIIRKFYRKIEMQD